jgi:hypothetical protein
LKKKPYAFPQQDESNSTASRFDEFPPSFDPKEEEEHDDILLPQDPGRKNLKGDPPLSFMLRMSIRNMENLHLSSSLSK